MKLIVGLGNPGTVYQHTRHNIGSIVVKALAKGSNAAFKRGLFSSALTAKASLEGKPCLLAVPLTYMNVSGPAVAGVVKKHKVALEDLIVVFDDLDLEFGRLRLRPGGSSGGHNGITSVIESLGTKDFCRMRIGIGRPASADPDVVARYVLSEFTKKEKPQLDGIVESACTALRLWVAEGVEQSMNRINVLNR